MKTKRLLLLAFVPFFFQIQAQVLKPCGTVEANQRYFDEHPELQEQILKDRKALETVTPSAKRKQGSIYIIPIVFHIIHNYGLENISDAQIMSEMDQLNKDYRKRNLDTADVWPYFKPRVADAEIEFRLAQIDPNGNCTNGIDRIASSRTYEADDGSKLNDWDPKKYLNVWVVKTIGSQGTAGYAYYPSSGGGARDGIIILSDYIGNVGTSQPITSRALTHEIGHYLNLAHVWGSTNNPGSCGGDDGVADTPPSYGWTSCVNQTISKKCDPDSSENVQNYMEYSYCSNMFTKGQAQRMQNALNSTVAGRNNLWSDANLIATGTDDGYIAKNCMPKADFMSDSYVVCVGTPVTFSDVSYRGKVVKRIWSLPGCTITSGSDTSGKVVGTYSQSGDYAVKLKVYGDAANGSAPDSMFKDNIIHVVPNGNGSPLSYSDGLEYTQVLGSGWQVLGLTDDKVNWTFGDTNAIQRRYCAKLNLANANHVGNTHELITPALDFTKIQKGYLHFKVAYRKRGNTSSDVLNIYYSFDCSDNWALIGKGIPADVLSEKKSTGSSYVPAKDDWITQNVYLPSKYVGESAGVKFKFSVTVGNNGNTNNLTPGGNNLYLDGIIVDTIPDYTAVSGIRKVETLNSVELYPNPAHQQATLSFGMLTPAKVSVNVYDILGHVVCNVLTEKMLSEGIQELTIPVQQSGVFIVKIKMDDGSEKALRLIAQ